ncbi:MAG TPA: hypothetical protein VI542_33395 [Candidatus Tectomicrobia bacterium]
MSDHMWTLQEALQFLPPPCLLSAVQKAALAACVVPATQTWWGEQPGKTRLAVYRL